MGKTFTYYGSCVTRDVFNFLDNKVFVPKCSMPWASIAAMNFPGLPVEMSDPPVLFKLYKKKYMHGSK